MNTSVVVMLVIVAIVVFLISKSIKNRPVEQKIINRDALAKFGRSKEDRREGIKEFFAQQAGMINMLVDVKKPIRCRTFIERNLATLEPIERFALEVIYHLQNEGEMGDNNFFLTQLGLMYGDGKGGQIGYSTHNGKPFKTKRIPEAAFQNMVTGYCGVNLSKSINNALNRLENAVEKDPDNPIFAELHLKVAGQPVSGGQFDLDDFLTPDDG